MNTMTISMVGVLVFVAEASGETPQVTAAMVARRGITRAYTALSLHAVVMVTAPVAMAQLLAQALSPGDRYVLASIIFFVCAASILATHLIERPPRRWLDVSG